ncbi:hypothetical protein NUU61_007575 [Penicillium alfredii]|uniref:Ferritin n=1 Tax=Penicillium alfredii TaxID=1506179 RepID=A0A9W9EQQ4_9EURO|nr:uncharacterized protein NUU61_007575 [Penicillium alfredii]KAJ5086268.1 hypothetical protein NUU61_007575 [Penicillium alfredii]
MSHAEEARKVIGDLSKQNIDDLVRPSSLTEQLEESVRGHIHQELTSWMFYRKLAADCSRANVALHGFAMLWERSARECLIDMHWLEKYLVTRGGRCKPTNIEAPTCEFSDNPVEPVAPCKEAFLTEKQLLEDLERLCSLAEKSGESALTEAIQTRFLRKEAKHVKNLGDLLKQVARVSKTPGLGLHLLDMQLRNHKGVMPWTVLNDPDRHNEAVELGIGLMNSGPRVCVSHEDEEVIADIHRTLTGKSHPGHDYSELHSSFDKFLEEQVQGGKKRSNLGVCFQAVSTWGEGDGHADVKTVGTALWRTLTQQDIYEWTIQPWISRKKPQDGRPLIRDFSGVVHSGEIMLQMTWLCVGGTQELTLNQRSWTPGSWLLDLPADYRWPTLIVLGGHRLH